MGNIDMGVVFSKSWDLFSKNALPLIVGTLICFVLGVVTLGIALPALTAGMYIIINKSWEGETAVISDIFNGFNDFGRYFFGGVIYAVASIIGILLCGVGILFTTAILLIFFPLMVDRGMQATDAMSLSFDLFKLYWLGFLVLLLASTIIESMGNLIPFGVLLTMPYAKCMVYVGYQQVMEGEKGDNRVALNEEE
ncbi:MAG: hypothetical protein HQK84_01615 [Nitrospinae bacterium]|nr:hypothetical protein [Nitrospinota bacterium]